MNAAARQPRRVRLLPFRADRVVDAEALLVAASGQFDIVAAVLDQHAPEQLAAGVAEFVVFGKVPDDVLGSIRAEHLGHSGARPGLRHLLVARGAGLAARICSGLVSALATRFLAPARIDPQRADAGPKLPERLVGRAIGSMYLLQLGHRSGLGRSRGLRGLGEARKGGVAIAKLVIDNAQQQRGDAVGAVQGDRGAKRALRGRELVGPVLPA